MLTSSLPLSRLSHPISPNLLLPPHAQRRDELRRKQEEDCAKEEEKFVEEQRGMERQREEYKQKKAERLLKLRQEQLSGWMFGCDVCCVRWEDGGCFYTF